MTVRTANVPRRSRPCGQYRRPPSTGACDIPWPGQCRPDRAGPARRDRPRSGALRGGERRRGCDRVCWSASRQQAEASRDPEGHVPWRSRLLLKSTGRRPGQTLVGAERLAATARRRGLRVLDREAAARHGIDEVDFGAPQIPDADRIDETASRRGTRTPGRLRPVRSLHHQPVLESRTATALHEDAQAASSLVFFGQQLADFRRRRF